jgi:hypothetical protein
LSGLYSQGHGLIVGVGADLPNTVNDASGLAKILRDKDRCAYPEHQVALLAGPEATRNNIFAELDKLRQHTATDSTVIIYFSGHGYTVTSSAGQMYYIMPFGYDLNQLCKTAISGAEFTDKVCALKVRQLLVLLDCCHAGGFENIKAADLEFNKAPLPPEATDRFAEGSGRVLIASSMANELSYAGKPYSVFTVALVEALCGEGVAKKDGYVRWIDLALHTREMVPRRTKNKQHPIVNMERADNFIVAYYAGGEAQGKGLPFESTPEAEPEPGAWTFNQQDQVVYGSQTNIAGGVHTTTLFSNPNWKVNQVNQIAGNLSMGTGPVAAGTSTRGMERLAITFTKMEEFLVSLAPEDQEEVRPILINARKLAHKIQRGEGSSDTEGRLEDRLRRLLLVVPTLTREALTLFAEPISDIAPAIQGIARKLLVSAE